MTLKDVPGPHASALEVREFVKRFDPTGEFRRLWGADFAEHVEALDDVLTAEQPSGKRGIKYTPPAVVTLPYVRGSPMA